MSETLSGYFRPIPRVAEPQPWISSPGFDLVFFILAPLVTLPVVIGVKYSIPVLAIIGIVLAVPHYFSTGSFLFWEENAAYQRSRLITFAGIPLLIAMVFVLAVGFHVPVVIQTALFVWTIFHVARQNCGIAGIYRHRAGVNDRRQKRVVNFAIMAVSLWFSLWFVGNHPDLKPIFDRTGVPIAKWLWIAAGCVAGFAVVRLGIELRHRAQVPGTIAWPERLFLAMSLTMFAPYALIHDVNVATYVMLLPHYVQYLGIVWLMNRRRAVASSQRDTLRKLSTSTVGLVTLLAGSGIAVASAFMYLRATTDLTLYTSIFNLIVFEHYYYDGVIWAFRNSHVRETMEPWLWRVGGMA